MGRGKVKVKSGGKVNLATSRGGGEENRESKIKLGLKIWLSDLKALRLQLDDHLVTL